MIRLENILKISLQDVLKTPSNRLGDVLKMSWRRFSRCLQNVLKTSWRCLEDVFASRLEDVWETSWRRLGKTSWWRLENVLKTSSDNVRLRRTYSSWSRRLEDVFWRWRRKTFSRRLHQDECLLGSDTSNSCL